MNAEESRTTENGEYRLLKKLGEGAAGEVYLATPTSPKFFAKTGDPLAIKIYKPEILKEPKQYERIEREFKIGSQLSHPNIVRIHDVSILKDGQSYLVMEYVDGITFGDWIPMFHPLGDKFLLQILVKIVSAISYLHEKGLIHRDIKPENIMLSSAFEPLIMDFGVVRIKEPKDKGITPSDKFLGTIRNSSPEMLYGEDYDEKTDLYSFGTVMYALLHGEQVFSNEKQFARLCDLVKNEEPKFDLSLELRSGSYSRLVALTKSLLQKKSADRPSSAEKVKESLEKIRKELALAEVEPMYGYMATALTGLEEDVREAIAFISHNIAEACKEFDIYVYQPRKATDPLLHQDIEPKVVYQLDRKRVIDADILFILANKPSFGVGQELEIASSFGKPTILLRREEIKVSRMITGSFSNLIGDIHYSTPEDLTRKLKNCLGKNIEKLRAWKSTAIEQPQIGHNLAKYREEAGYATIDEAAEALGVSRNLLSYLETHPFKYNNVTLNLIIRMCQLYRIRPNDISAFKSQKTKSSIKDVNIQRLEILAKKVGWSASDYFELRDEYQKEMAASGSTTFISDEQWMSYHSALEKRRLKGKKKEEKLF